MKRLILLGSLLVLGALGIATCAGAQTLVLQDAMTPSWSPDGSALVCVRPTPTYDDEDMQIWRVSPDGGDATLLFTDPDGAFHPIWMPDGSRVLYHHWNGERGYEFVIRDLTGANPTVWSVANQGFTDDWGVSLSPAGDEVLYTRDQGGSVVQTWALNLSNGSCRFVWDGAGAAISPDGRWIAYTGAGDEFVVSSLESAGVTDSLGIGAFPAWSPDSRWVYFTRLQSDGTADLTRSTHVSAHSVVERLTFDSDIEWGCAVAPAGDRVAYWKSAGEFEPISLWMLDTPASEPLAVALEASPDVLNPRSRGSWITTYVELPNGRHPSEIDLESVRLNGVIHAVPGSLREGDFDGDGVLDAAIKFDRADVVALAALREASAWRPSPSDRRIPKGASPGSAEFIITVTGRLGDRRNFSGSDVVRILAPREKAAAIEGRVSGRPVGLVVLPSIARREAAIEYDAPSSGTGVRIRVYDVAGRSVRTLEDRSLAQGRRQLRWDLTSDLGTSVPSGLYFVRLDSAAGTLVSRIMVVR